MSLLNNTSKAAKAAALEAKVAAFIAAGGQFSTRGPREVTDDQFDVAPVKTLSWEEALDALAAIGEEYAAREQAKLELVA